MLKYILIIVLLLAGCQRGDFKAQVVIEGQIAPFDGYNIGPDIYVSKGQPCKLTGAVIWIEGLELVE